ncbi:MULTISPECIES: hypothetical protein [unclassified Streptomyces]|uniref:hypothetical protein n=1 Tax=unclassified Streptomyces TaxID=2593676 RepID=UPI0033321754
MRTTRISLGTAAVLASVVAALATTQAQAVGTTDTGASADRGAVMMVLPKAPEGARFSPTAAAPTVSPSAPYIHAKEGLISCPGGSLCTSTWDPTAGSWKIYKLDKCAKYALSNWEGDGAYRNNQTGGVVSKFYDQNGNVLKSVPSDNTPHAYKWSPVWSIRNC